MKRRHAFEGKFAPKRANRPSKIERGVKQFKPRKTRAQRRMDRESKAIKATRGYEMIYAFIERGIRINSTQA